MYYGPKSTRPPLLTRAARDDLLVHGAPRRRLATILKECAEGRIGLGLYPPRSAGAADKIRFYDLSLFDHPANLMAGIWSVRSAIHVCVALRIEGMRRHGSFRRCAHRNRH